MATQKILTRDFILTFFAQFAFSSVFCMLIPTLPIYLSRKGSTEAEIGILIGTFSLASLIFRPFVGRTLTKIPERDFMIVGSLLYVFSSLAYLVAPPFWPLLIVRIIQGLGLALFATASFTLIANIIPVAHRGRMISYFYLSINFAFVLGPYLGMLIINHLNFATLFYVCTGLSLVSFLILTKLKRRGMDLTLKNTSVKNPSFLNREALPSAIMAFMVNIMWGALMAFFPLYALSHRVYNPGFFFAAFAITLIITRAFGGKILDIYSREEVILPCLITMIVSSAIFTFSTTLPMFLLVAVIWGLGMAFLYPTLVAHALDHAGDAYGPAMGTFTAVADLGSGLGSVIMGIILHLTSYRTMFLCLILTGIINLSYFLFIVKKRREDQYAHL